MPTKITKEENGPRGMREHHYFHVTIVRVDGTPVTYERCKHVLYQNHSLLLIIGNHNENRQYVRYPESIIDHVIAEEIANK